MSHTPIPWSRFHPGDDGENKFWHIGPNTSDDICTVWSVPNGDADSAFIVKACNAHDALVTALRRVIEWHDAGCDLSSASVEAARAALKLAEGD